jgi:sarcosine oxidase
MIYDVAVVGLGGHGSACVAKLAMKGLKTIGFDKFESSNAHGSSHGRSRYAQLTTLTHHY